MVGCSPIPSPDCWVCPRLFPWTQQGRGATRKASSASRSHRMGLLGTINLVIFPHSRILSMKNSDSVSLVISGLLLILIFLSLYICIVIRESNLKFYILGVTKIFSRGFYKSVSFVKTHSCHFSHNMYLLIMLLQLSQFSPFASLLPTPHFLRQSPHHCSYPWVMHVSSLATPFLILYFTSPWLFCDYLFVLLNEIF